MDDSASPETEPAQAFPLRDHLDMLIWVIIGAQLVLAFVTFPYLPSIIPSHFGIRGVIYARSPKWFANLLIPSICAIVLLLQVRQIAVPRLGSREQQAAGAQRRKMLFLGIALVLLIFQIIGTALDLGFAVQGFAPQGVAGASQNVNGTEATESLIDRARMAPGWRSLGTLTSNAFRESSIVYDAGNYYIFNTYVYETNGVAVRVASTPEGIVSAKPITNLAPLVYPTVVKDAATGMWHMWGRNAQSNLTQHYTSYSPTSGWIFSDNITINLNDYSVAKSPTDGNWYGIGFLTGMGPLTLLRASNPGGPWISLGDVFAGTGAPPFSDNSRPDPDLALGVDGHNYVFFTGHPSTILTNQYFPSIAELDLATGRVKSSPVVLFDDEEDWASYTGPLSDLQFLRVPGQPDRIFGFTNDSGGGGNWSWGCLDLANLPLPSDGRRQDDLVRLDMQKDLDVATGIRPALLQGATWQGAGLDITAPGGGAYGYPAMASLGDVSMNVDFTPTAIAPGAINTIACLLGTDYAAGPSLCIYIDTDGVLKAAILGNSGPPIVLASSVRPQANKLYSVVFSKEGAAVNLWVNNNLEATGAHNVDLTDIEVWSVGGQKTLDQGTRYPFVGTINAFDVSGDSN